MIYLDSAATTFQKPASVLRSVYNAMLETASPARGGYPQSEKAGEIIFEARREIKELFGLSDERHVIFTKNATEALNIAIQGFTRPGDEVVISCLEHNAVVRPLQTGRRNWKIAHFRADRPETAVESFDRLLNRRTKLAVCTLVSNVFGSILPCGEIGLICRKRGIPFVVDASQAAGCLCFNPESLCADAVCMPGHKSLYGPPGTGLMLVSGHNLPRSLIQGGTGTVSAELRQPGDLPELYESGTPNTPGIAGLLEGIRFVKRETPRKILRHERMLINRLIPQISDAYNMPALATEENRAGVLALIPKYNSIAGVEETLIREGICVRTGLQCAPLAHRSQNTFKTGVIRISTSFFNTEDEIDRAAKVLMSAAKLR